MRLENCGFYNVYLCISIYNYFISVKNIYNSYAAK